MNLYVFRVVRKASVHQRDYLDNSSMVYAKLGYSCDTSSLKREKNARNTALKAILFKVENSKNRE